MALIALKKVCYTCTPSIVHPFLDRIKASDTGSRLARGIFWSMAGSVISRGMMLCATVLVARILGKTVYGELGMIQSTVGMFGVFAGFGLGLTATKHVAAFRISAPERVGRIIGISGLLAMGTGSLMAMGLFIFAPWLADHTINAPHLAGVLRIGAIILFIEALNGAQTGALSGFEAFKTIAYVNLTIGLISFPFLICGAYFGGLSGAVGALAINLCFNWLLNHIALRKEMRNLSIPLTFKGCGHELPVLWSFALPATFGGIMVGPTNWVCRALLTNQPNGYDEMGILTAALVTQGILLFASNMLSAPLLSMVSNAGTNISDKLSTVNILLTWVIGVIAAIPLICFPEITQVLFGTEFNTRSFSVTLSIVAFYTSVMMYSAGMARVLVANSLLWWGVLSNILWATILVTSSLFLVRWGAQGLAASFAIAYVLSAVIFFPFYHSRKLVPKGTLLSFEAVAIWFVLVGIVTLNIANVSLLFRSLAFLPSMLIVGIAFARMAKGATVTKKR